jgi:hypothetical protein
MDFIHGMSDFETGDSEHVSTGTGLHMSRVICKKTCSKIEEQGCKGKGSKVM